MLTWIATASLPHSTTRVLSYLSDLLGLFSLSPCTSCFILYLAKAHRNIQNYSLPRHMDVNYKPFLLHPPRSREKIVPLQIGHRSQKDITEKKHLLCSHLFIYDATPPPLEKRERKRRNRKCADCASANFTFQLDLYARGTTTQKTINAPCRSKLGTTTDC